MENDGETPNLIFHGSSTGRIRICQGSYEVELCLAWEEWDAVRTSDNDHPMLFPEHQVSCRFCVIKFVEDLEL